MIIVIIIVIILHSQLLPKLSECLLWRQVLSQVKRIQMTISRTESTGGHPSPGSFAVSLSHFWLIKMPSLRRRWTQAAHYPANRLAITSSDSASAADICDGVRFRSSVIRMPWPDKHWPLSVCVFRTYHRHYLRLGNFAAKWRRNCLEISTT